MIATLSIALGIPFLLGLGFIVLLFLARRENPVMERNTLPPEEIYYNDLDHPNGLWRI